MKEEPAYKQPMVRNKGMDPEVSEFLNDMDSTAVIPPNMGFVQTDFVVDQYDNDFHPNWPLEHLPPYVKFVPGVNYRTEREKEMYEKTLEMQAALAKQAEAHGDAVAKMTFARNEEDRLDDEKHAAEIASLGKTLQEREKELKASKEREEELEKAATVTEDIKPEVLTNEEEKANRARK